MGSRFAFTPEVGVQSTIERNQQMFTTVAAPFSYSFANFSLAAGPNVSWGHRGLGQTPGLYLPENPLYQYEFDKRNSLIAGLQVALRFTIK